MSHGFASSSPADRERLSRWAVHFEGAKQASEFAGRRSRRFTLITEAPNANELPEKAKRVMLVRHGEGHHNVWRRVEHAAGRTPHAKRTNMDQVPSNLHDPLLTESGEKEVAATSVSRSAGLSAGTTRAIELAITSPQRRAVQTCLAVFQTDIASKSHPPPIIAHELCREQFRGLDPSIYDSRKPRDELAAAFPSVDFQSFVLPADGEIGDPIWWACGSVFGGCEGGAHEAAMVENAYGFLCWLMSRPEKCIGVATHSLFLLALYHGCLTPSANGGGGGDGPRHDGPQVFSTAELRDVIIVESAAPVDAPGAELETWSQLLTSQTGLGAGGEVGESHPVGEKRKAAALEK